METTDSKLEAFELCPPTIRLIIPSVRPGFLFVTSDPTIGLASSAQESERDREARLEELLLSGLDYYFAGQHELAINVWTRALFIDRGHARARAYIERARSAIAEASAKLKSSSTRAQPHFSGVNPKPPDGCSGRRSNMARQPKKRSRCWSGLTGWRPPASRRTRATSAATRPGRPRLSPIRPGRDRSWLGWIAAGVLLGLAAAAVTIGILWTRGEQWLPLDSGSTESSARLREEPLPIPAASDVSIARAQAQYERGHLREALLALEAVGPGDPLSAEADQLKATIQAKLLEAARSDRFPAGNAADRTSR